MTLPFAIDPLPAWIAAAWIATLFAHAALAKFTDLALFEQHLSAYRVPDAGLTAVSRSIPALELAAAILLLSPWRSAGAWLAATLLLAYGAAMAWHRWHGHELDCGCGGEPLPVSWALVARNAGLAGLALLPAWALTDRPLAWADFAVVAAAVPLGTLLYAALNQILRHQAGLRLRHVHQES
jgi:Methylamine utilisation protein MauE